MEMEAPVGAETNTKNEKAPCGRIYDRDGYRCDGASFLLVRKFQT